MIDKLDLRIPSMTPFARAVAAIGAELRRGPVGPFRPSTLYTYKGDLRRDFDIDAIVHLEFKFGECNHKLEILDAGTKTLSEMADVVSCVFDVDPFQLQMMRLDLAADVPGIRVPWFRDNARFQYKRFASRIEKANGTELEFIGMGTAEAQSLYAGRRPNCVRIYDKIAEWMRQWRKIVREYERFNRNMAGLDMSEDQRYYGVRLPPSFEAFCQQQGFTYSDRAILTRVERQIGGDKFPDHLRTVADLRHAPEFNPFGKLEICGGTALPDKGYSPELSIRDYLAVRGLQDLVREMGGAQHAFGFVLKHGNGNGRRVLDALTPHLPREEPGITALDIYRLYRDSVQRQVAA